MGASAGMNYLTGFVVEKSLAMDNVFVIAMIFTYFAVPRSISTGCCSGAYWASSSCVRS
jgi:predicted tellurium resistance membrane protein TerC